LFWLPFPKLQSQQRAQERIQYVPGKKTKHIELPLEPQAPPARKGENIQTGGGKVGVRSGAAKSDSTRAKRRSGAAR
jgi:hypothetical protein